MGGRGGINKFMKGKGKGGGRGKGGGKGGRKGMVWVPKLGGRGWEGEWKQEEPEGSGGREGGGGGGAGEGVCPLAAAARYAIVAYISPIYLPYISLISALYLHYISPKSPPYRGEVRGRVARSGRGRAARAAPPCGGAALPSP